MHSAGHLTSTLKALGFDPQHCVDWAQWFLNIILALERSRHQKFKASLRYILKLRSSWARDSVSQGEGATEKERVRGSGKESIYNACLVPSWKAT